MVNEQIKNSDQLLVTIVTNGEGKCEGCLEGNSSILPSKSFTAYVMFPHWYLIS